MLALASQALASIKQLVSRTEVIDFRNTGQTEVTGGGERKKHINVRSSPAAPQPSNPIEDAGTDKILMQLRRRATIELFEWLSLTHVPGQIWPLVETYRDPIKALETFVRGIGCSFENIQRRDLAELERLQEVFDLLESARGLLENLDGSQNAWFQEQLLQGNYEKAKRLSQHFADLQELLTAADEFETDPTLYVFKTFVREVRSVAAEPFEVREEDVIDAKKHAREYYWRVEDFRRLNSYYDHAIRTYRDWFPNEWAGKDRETEIKNLAGHAATYIRELAESDFDFEAIDERLARLKYCIDRLQMHQRDGETARGEVVTIAQMYTTPLSPMHYDFLVLAKIPNPIAGSLRQQGGRS